MIGFHLIILQMTARLCITIADHIFEDVKNTKPAHRPMSQHIADLLVEALTIKKQRDGVVAMTESNEQNKISK